MVRQIIKKSIFAIIGPTASAKSNLAMALAKKISGEIVSCDSVQIYKDFNIGSAKAKLAEQAQIPHHLINVVSWRENFDAAQYRTLALKTIEAIDQRGHSPIIVGGTGLYFRALCGEKFHTLPQNKDLRKELENWTTEALYEKLVQVDPQRAQDLHPNDRFRLIRACEVALSSGKTLTELTQTTKAETFRPSPIILCQPARSVLEDKIRIRTENMLAEGLISEVQNLLSQGCPPDAKPMQSIGYKQVCSFLESKEKDKNKLFDAIVVASRQYARKQLMWFRKSPVDIKLENPYQTEACLQKILQL